MPCLVTDIAINLSPTNTPILLVGVSVLARPVLAPIFTLVPPFRPVNNPERRSITDDIGAWSFTLPWPSESDPTSLMWQLVLPDMSVWQGAIPEGVAGPISLHDLKQLYGWGLVAGGLQHAIPVAVAGPPGPTGPGLLPRFNLNALPDPELYVENAMIIARDPALGVDGDGLQHIVITGGNHAWRSMGSANPVTLAPITGDGTALNPITLDASAPIVWTGVQTFNAAAHFNDMVTITKSPSGTALTISAGDAGTVITVDANGFTRKNATLLIGADEVNITPGIRIGSQATSIEVDGVIAGVLTFSIGTDHILHVEDGINQGFGHNGGNLTVKAADGGPGLNPATNPGNAGTLFLPGAVGGEGTTLLAAKAGGDVQMIAGSAGQNQGGGGANGGNIITDAGPATGAGVNGTVSVGVTNANAVSVGRTGKLVTLAGDWTILNDMFGRTGTMKIYNDSNNGLVSTGANILMRINDVTQDTIGSGTRGFFGHAAVAQPAHPVTLGDVITALTNLGLTA